MALPDLDPGIPDRGNPAAMPNRRNTRPKLRDRVLPGADKLFDAAEAPYYVDHPARIRAPELLEFGRVEVGHFNLQFGQ
jgi:hypothetical protein